MSKTDATTQMTMKETTKKCMKAGRLVLMTVAMLTMLLTACSTGKKYKIGVSQCAPGGWRDKINNEMLAAQHLYEHDVQVSILCAYDDTQRQIRQIDSLVESGIDLLVVAPNEAGPIAKVIDRVKAKGIPVICFDRNVEGNNYTAFIGGSNVEAGHAVGVNVVDVARGMTAGGYKPFVLEITALMSSSPAQERHKGFEQAMAGHDELEYVCYLGDWSSETSYRVVKDYIMNGRCPDIVFCHNDGMATGVYRAVVETKTEGKVKIFGIDGMPGEGLDYVQFGHQTASYVYPTGGEEIIRLALDILTGRPYKRETILQGVLVVKENAWSVATTTAELMKQNKNLVTIQDKLEDYQGLYNTQQKALVAGLVLVVLLIIAMVVIWRAYVLVRRTTRQRQDLNEEETLFYTNPDSRVVRQVFKTTDDELPTPRHYLCRDTERGHPPAHVESEPEDGRPGRTGRAESRTAVSQGEGHHGTVARGTAATDAPATGLCAAGYDQQDRAGDRLRGRFRHARLLLEVFPPAIRQISYGTEEWTKLT